MENNYYPYVGSNVVVPPSPRKKKRNETVMIKMQVSGMILTSFILGHYLKLAYDSKDSFPLTLLLGLWKNLDIVTIFEFIFSAGIFLFKWGIPVYFYARIMFDKNFCSGKPDVKKLWPLNVFFFSCFLFTIQMTFIALSVLNESRKLDVIQLFQILHSAALTVLGYYLPVMWAWMLYFGDDSNPEDSNRCVFKPWRSYTVSADDHDDTSSSSNDTESNQNRESSFQCDPELAIHQSNLENIQESYQYQNQLKPQY